MNGGMTMTNPAVTVAELVQVVKKAVDHVQRDGSVTISRIELNMKTVLERSAQGEGTFLWNVLTASGSVKDEEIQTLNLKLKPSPPGTHGLNAEDLEYELTVAMNAIKIGVNEAERSEPRYTLEEATVEFNFSVTQEGQILIYKFGGSTRNERTHGLILTMTKRS